MRDPGAIRPLLLNNTDAKAIAATVAWAVNPIVRRGAHASQHRFVSQRDLSQKIVELDTYARAMHSTVAPEDHPVALFCDILAAFPSVRRPSSQTVLHLQGMPEAAIKVVEATNMDMPLLLRIGGVHKLGNVTSGIAQGCPLSGKLFVSAMGPLGRRLHSTLPEKCAGMSRQCADDMATLLRGVRFMRILAPTFDAADRCAGVRLKPSNCEVVMVGR